MSFETWLTFVLVWTATGLPPGPNAVACVAAAVANGSPRAFLVPLGIGLACVIHTLIVTLPGSPRGVTECLEIIMPVLGHALDILQEQTSEHPTGPPTSQ